MTDGITTGRGGNATLPLLTACDLLANCALDKLLTLTLNAAKINMANVKTTTLTYNMIFVTTQRVNSGLSRRSNFTLAHAVNLNIVTILITIINRILFTLFNNNMPRFLSVTVSTFKILIFINTSIISFFVLPHACGSRRCLSTTLSVCLACVGLFIFVLHLLVTVGHS